MAVLESFRVTVAGEDRRRDRQIAGIVRTQIIHLLCRAGACEGPAPLTADVIDQAVAQLWREFRGPWGNYLKRIEENGDEILITVENRWANVAIDSNLACCKRLASQGYHTWGDLAKLTAQQLRQQELTDFEVEMLWLKLTEKELVE